MDFSQLDELANVQIPFLLHLENYLVYERRHKVGHCHQLRLLLVHLMLSMAGSEPQEDIKYLLSEFLQACLRVLNAKGNWTKG